ncbi:MAG: hypothetical protein II038_02365 [Lachnospiraceae bacterium]|nr:hypothetical protein [Lachnospiraceae bacterium]
MDFDIDSILGMSYDEYVNTLVEKYGSVPHDYYRNEVCLTRSGNSRSREGLVIHHIDEDKEAGLSSMWKYRNPFSMPEEYQKADRLVYCNLVEHLLLHMKILEKELTRIVPERRVDNVVSVKGFALIAKNINDLLAGKNIGMLSNYVSSQELNERYLRVLDDSWITLFVNAIKYFVENIERRSDFQEWYGARLENIDYILKTVHMIYDNNPTDYDTTIKMEDYHAW